MKKQLLIFLSIFLLCFYGVAQQFQLSPNAEISVLTIGSGESLNDAFGHSGFRIKDPNRGLDVVYGYGKYDFNAPNFYLKFARGKLDYLISKNRFLDIYNTYSFYDRSIDEQVLNLSENEKQKLYNYLIHNYKPENRGYLYDFFFDNCATRIRDVVQNATDNTVIFSASSTKNSKTFRQLIREYVGTNTWGSFGIDLALGSVIDKKATPTEYMFLPNYIHSSFASATINGSKPLVKQNISLYKSKHNTGYKTPFIFSPIIVLSVLALFVFYITYKDFKKQKRSSWLDIIICIITGLIGVAILLLWFATDHSTTSYNYNLLWAFPLNLLLLLQLAKSSVKKWALALLKFLVIMLCLLTLHWIMDVQVFATALIPILLTLVVRYIYLLRYFRTN